MISTLRNQVTRALRLAPILMLVAVPATAQHAEPEGYVVRDESGTVLIHEWQGTMLADLEIEILHEESTDSLFVQWLDADSLAIDPDSLPVADFSLEVSVDNGTLVSVEYLGQFVFRLNGLEEGMTLGRICLYHDGHCDFTGQDFEVHVEEEHFEADGLVIRKNGNVIVTVWQGNVTGSIEVLNGASTDSLEVAFLSPDSLEGDLETDPDFLMEIGNNTPTIASMTPLDKFGFRANGLQLGSGSITLCLYHIDHCDFTSVNVPVEVLTATPVGPAPTSVSLRAFPNPFASATRLEVSLAREESVRIDVYDVAGRLVRTVFDGRKGVGDHSFALDGGRLASGVYFVKVATPTSTNVRKVVLTR